MKKNLYILLILFLFCMNKLIGQQQVSSFETEIMKFKSNMEFLILQNLTELSISEEDKSNITIKVIPYCYINDFCNIKDMNYIEKLLICSDFFRFTIEYKNMNTSYLCRNGISGIESINIVEQTNHQNLVTHAENLTSNYLFIYFLDNEKFQDKYIGIINDSQLSLINENFQKIENIEDEINKNFGYLEKYCEDSKYEKLRDSLKINMNFEKAKQLIKTDYRSWLKYYPNEISIAIKLLINEIDTIASITTEQRNILQEELFMKLRKGYFNKFTFYGFPFHNSDISLFIESVLTEEQYYNYLQNSVKNHLEIFVAREFLFNYYIRERKISENELEKTMKNEIFEYDEKFTMNFLRPFFWKINKLTHQSTENNQRHWVDENSSINLNSEKEITENYGCLEKYYEILKIENYKDSILKSMNFETAKHIVRNDFEQWLHYNPKDSLKIIELFVNEIYTLIGIAPDQQKQIHDIILKNLRKENFDTYDLTFNDYWRWQIERSLLVLTENQYYNYLRQNNYKNLEQSIALNYLHSYYKNEQKIPKRKIEETIKIEVF